MTEKKPAKATVMLENGEIKEYDKFLVIGVLGDREVETSYKYDSFAEVTTIAASILDFLKHVKVHATEAILLSNISMN